jgi:hypothetical protein
VKVKVSARPYMRGRPTWPRCIRRDVASARERVRTERRIADNSRQPFKIVMSSRAQRSPMDHLPEQLTQVYPGSTTALTYTSYTARVGPPSSMQCDVAGYLD